MGELQTNTGEEQAVNTQAEGEEESQNTGSEEKDESQEESNESDDEQESSEEEESESEEEDADEEPKTRKRNVDFILERKNRKIEKLKNKMNADNDDDEFGGDEDDDDIDEDDAKIIQKQVNKVLTPFLQKQMQEEDNQEIQSFVKDNPDFAPYVDKVKKFAQHDSRKHLPIQSIFYEVAGKDLLRIGALRAKKVNEEAKETSAGGGSTLGGESDKSVWDLTPEEFAQRQEELRNKPRE